MQPFVAADPTAVVGRRVVAFLLDSLAIFVLVAVFGLSFLSSAVDSTELSSGTEARDRCHQINRDAVYRTDPDRSDGTSTGDLFLLEDEPICLPIGQTVYVTTVDRLQGVFWKAGLLSFLFHALNGVLLQGLTGATVGKHLLGLRVLRPSGELAGMGRCLVRALVGVVDGICGGIVGLIAVFTSDGHQRVGDMAADTYVVSSAAAGTLLHLPHKIPFGGPPAPPPWTAPEPRTGPIPPGPTPFGQTPFGQPPSGGSFAGGFGQAPAPWQAPAPAAQEVAPQTSGEDARRWDPIREAWLAPNPDGEGTLIWDEAAQQWHPLEP